MAEKRRQTTPTFPDVTPEQRKFLEEHERLHAQYNSIPKNSDHLLNVPRQLTPEERRLVARHERDHWATILFPNPADREKRLAWIVAFENGEADSIPPQVSSPKPAATKAYFVHWGWMLRHIEEFTDFQRALDYFVDHRGGPCGARLVGEGYDADCDKDGFHEASDGLTDEERARVEAVL